MNEVLQKDPLLFATPFFAALIAIEVIINALQHYRLYHTKDSIASILMGAVAVVIGLGVKIVAFFVFSFLNQFALFSLMSHPEASLDEWIRTHPEHSLQIVIPAELKWEIRDKLDQANITERVLFPGLDGLSQWLKRYFTTRK